MALVDDQTVVAEALATKNVTQANVEDAEMALLV